MAYLGGQYERPRVALVVTLQLVVVPVIATMFLPLPFLDIQQIRPDYQFVSSASLSQLHYFLDLTIFYVVQKSTAYETGLLQIIFILQ